MSSLCLAIATTAASAATPPQARLVHCGSDTCLRIAGHRPRPDIAVRVAGHDLVVEGGRSWRATVSLETARGWAGASGDTLTLGLVDARTGLETVDAVAVPPGALGRRIELASLVISAH